MIKKTKHLNQQDVLFFILNKGLGRVVFHQKGRHYLSVKNFVLFILIIFCSPVVFCLTPITINTLSNFGFGKFAAGSGGTVVLSNAGVRTKTGGVTIIPSSSSSNAVFQISGSPSQAYVITLPSNNSVYLNSGANTLYVSDFTVAPSVTGTLNALGVQTITFGATLNIDSNKPPGDYSGSFSFSVDYQ